MLFRANAGQRSMNEKGLRDRSFFVLLLLMLVVRIGLFVAVQPWDPVVQKTIVLSTEGDAPGYHEYALRIIEGRALGDLGVTRTPGYPLIIAAVYSVFGVKPWLVLLLQIAASAVTFTLLYRLTSSWFNRSAAIAACAMYALDPHAVLYTNQFLTDSIFAMVFFMSVMVFLRALDTRNILTFFWAGALVGVATLIRPLSQFLPVVYIILSLLFLRKFPSSALRGTAVLLLAYLIVLAPWLYRNFNEYGSAQLTSIGGNMLLDWTVPYVEAARTGKDISEVRQEFTEIAQRNGLDKTSNPFEQSRIRTKVAIDYIMQHKMGYMAGSLRGVFYSFINLDTSGYARLLQLQSKSSPDVWYGGDSLTSRIHKFINMKSTGEIVIGTVIVVILTTTYLFCLVGVWCLLTSRDYWPVIFSGALIGYCLLFIGPIGVARYKLPFIPLYLSIAGYGFYRIRNLIISRRTV